MRSGLSPQAVGPKLGVVPAKAGTHNHRALLLNKAVAPARFYHHALRLWVPDLRSASLRLSGTTKFLLPYALALPQARRTGHGSPTIALADLERLLGEMPEIGVPVLGDRKPRRHPDVLVLPDVVEEAHQGGGTAGAADDTAMQADRHHFR